MDLLKWTWKKYSRNRYLSPGRSLAILLPQALRYRLTATVITTATHAAFEGACSRVKGNDGFEDFEKGSFEVVKTHR